MNEKLIEDARQLIRKQGFLKSIDLMLRLNIARKYPEVNVSNLFDCLPCEDVHRVEYTNCYVEDFRVKDLFYYNPHLNS